VKEFAVGVFCATIHTVKVGVRFVVWGFLCLFSKEAG